MIPANPCDNRTPGGARAPTPPRPPCVRRPPASRARRRPARSRTDERIAHTTHTPPAAVASSDRGEMRGARRSDKKGGRSLRSVVGRLALAAGGSSTRLVQLRRGSRASPVVSRFGAIAVVCRPHTTAAINWPCLPPPPTACPLRATTAHGRRRASHITPHHTTQPHPAPPHGPPPRRAALGASDHHHHRSHTWSKSIVGSSSTERSSSSNLPS